MNKRLIIDSKALSRLACLIATIIACNDLTKIKLGNGLFNYLIYIILVLVCVAALLLKPKLQTSLALLLWSLFYLVILSSSINVGLLFSGVNIRIFAVIVYLTILCIEDFDQVKIGIYVIIGYSFFQALGIYLQVLFPGAYENIFNLITVFFNLQEGGTSYEKLRDYGYFRGFCINPGFTAIYIVNGIICLNIFKEKISKYKYFIINSSLIIALVLTGKRGQLLAFVIGFAVVYIVCSNNLVSHLRHVFGVVAIMLILYSVGFYLYVHYPDIPGFSRTLNLVYGSNTDFNRLTSGRANLWDVAVLLYRENKVFGIGWNQYLHIRGMLPHNTYLQILCELGGVGIILFLSSLVVTLVSSIKTFVNSLSSDNSGYEKPLLKAFIFFQVYFIVYSVSGNTLWDPPAYYMYFILMAISKKYMAKIVRLKI